VIIAFGIYINDLLWDMDFPRIKPVPDFIRGPV
jgi:hypothetical protein